MKPQGHLALSLAIAAASLTFPASAQIASGVMQNTGARISNTVVSAAAKPIVNKLPAPDTSHVQALTATTVSKLSPGFVPGSAAVAAGVGPRAFGSFGLPYMSTRVQLGPSNQNLSVGPAYLSTTFPYRAVGKLFINGGYCSASLIRRSVIVTAAHCIQDFGSGANVFGGWIFVPGHYGSPGATTAQIMPYGFWPWAALNRPVTWMNGADPGSGAARANDVAVIILAKNGSNQFLGDLTGWLGYGWNNYSFIASPKTGNLSVAATATLGYPFLMDGGAIMQRADGPSYLTTIGGAGQIWQGNNFTGGSSGGPWVVNFVSYNPVLSGGAVIGTAANRAVVGVTSWGSADPNAIKDNYSSRFGQNAQYPNAAYGVYGAGNIGALIQQVCNAKLSPGVTFAAAGYCD